MFPYAIAALNQQMSAAFESGRQGMLAETQGNNFGAAQWYNQAILQVQGAMASAQQFGVFIPDQIYYTLAYAGYSAARANSQLGNWPEFWRHCNGALWALNAALAINPNQVMYHVAAGSVLLAQGNLPEAERALSTALRLNPQEPWAQYMLAVLNSARGNATAAEIYYTAARQTAPGLPQVPVTIPGSYPGMSTASPAGPATNDWGNTIISTCKVLESVFQTIGSFNTMTHTF